MIQHVVQRDNNPELRPPRVQGTGQPAAASWGRGRPRPIRGVTARWARAKRRLPGPSFHRIRAQPTQPVYR